MPPQKNDTTEVIELPPALNFMRDVWALNHALERTSKRMEVTLGLTAQQRVLLRIVGRRPGISAGTLARLLYLDAGTISASVGRLVRRGLMERTVDSEDRRRIVLTLTAKGKELDVPSPGTVEAATESFLAAGTPERAALVAEGLRTLAALLNEQNPSRVRSRPRT